MKQRSLELLSPAANADIAIEAIKHGADAVYIGASSHGARKAASNTLDDISRVVDFAHRFRSKVYVTVNTIVYDSELHAVEALCRELYHIGVDALIVQDMGLLRLQLPPIALHASTQCDIRTPEKARFLQDVGFSQLVLARELTLREIRDIAESVSIPVESFIHGALCVSYSGRCHASCAATGRSANRGECAQICRLPYSLIDSEGRTLAKDKYLLSLKDFNATDMLPDLIEAGVRSFKIEGRLKDAGYVKNITSHYDKLLNGFISNHEGFIRSSYGTVERSFMPKPDKSFNRGFTEYFLRERRPENIGSLDTPKSMGEEIKEVSELHNGDGISFFDKKGVYQGVNINKVTNGKIVAGRTIDIPRNATLHRTFDVEWQKLLSKSSANRKINLSVEVNHEWVLAKDERGVEVLLPFDVTKEVARRPMDIKAEFDKLGTTIYRLNDFKNDLGDSVFIPRSELSEVRRKMIELLDVANLSTYPFEYRREEDKTVSYPLKKLDFRENVSNRLAEEFFRDHGVTSIGRAMEVTGAPVKGGTVVMTTRHCILRELGMCKRLKRGLFKEPFRLKNDRENYRLHFNCADCEMEVLTD